MVLKLKYQLQYERDFCDLMCELGNHAERVASSGRRRKSVCDAVVITMVRTYLAEVKATKEKTFYMRRLHGLVEVADKFNIKPLVAVRFKGNPHMPGKWVWKIITPGLNKVVFEDESDPI